MERKMGNRMVIRGRIGWLRAPSGRDALWAEPLVCDICVTGSRLPHQDSLCEP